MKNQPSSPVGLFIFLGLIVLSGFVVGSMISWETGFLVGGLIFLLFALVLFSFWRGNKSESANIDESGEIVTATWALANEIGMQSAQVLRDKIATCDQHGIWRYRRGCSLKDLKLNSNNLDDYMNQY